jgi:CheY-like chemotaxis protein
MTLTRPRLVLLPGEAPEGEGLVESLRGDFEVVRVPDVSALKRLIDEDPEALLLCTAQLLRQLSQSAWPETAANLLQRLGEGVGLVEAGGALAWQNARLSAYDQQVRTRFAELGRQAIEQFNQDPQQPLDRRPSRRFSFSSGERHFELVASPASEDPSAPGRVASAVGVLWDVTASRGLLEKLEAIDVAGSELMKFEPDSIRKLSMADRLKLLEERIVHTVVGLLHFEDFEIRMIDPESNRLDLVLTRGIAPLRIGEVIYAEPEGNGISGYVACTGQSYLCPDVRVDPLYREGLENAACSLTVPLRLYDRTIGTFNIESRTPGTFDENDRQFAAIYGRYIAMAMNILNLLVVERYTTNEQMARTVLGELSEPLAEITQQAQSLREDNLADGLTRRGLDRIIESVQKVRRRVESCTAGPRSIIGAEQELLQDKPDPEMLGRRVLVADDNEEIRSSVCAILTRRGCDVTMCTSGRDTIEALRATAAGGPGFDLVISDIKMPDRSGYEVFRAAREASATTPVILMTGFGYDPHHSIVRASQEGLQSFLFKPFKAKQLIEEVKKALALGRRASQLGSSPN